MIWQQHLIHVKQYTQAPDRMKEGDVFKASHDKQAAAMEQGVQVSGNPLESAQVSPAFLQPTRSTDMISIIAFIH